MSLQPKLQNPLYSDMSPLYNNERLLVYESAFMFDGVEHSLIVTIGTKKSASWKLKYLDTNKRGISWL